MGSVIDCPNLRYKETKKGGFLGFGAQGYYYCSITGDRGEDNDLKRAFMNQRCCGKRDARQGDNPRYTACISGTNYASGFLDCTQYKTYGIRN